MLNEIPGVVCPRAAGRVLLLPVRQGRAGPGDRRPAAADLGRAGRADPGRGRGRGGAGRGVRDAGLLPAVLRARGRRPGRRRQPDRPSCSARRGRQRSRAALPDWAMARPLAALPKAHLHLHFTGVHAASTLVDLADEHGIAPARGAASRTGRPQLSAADERGWFRFQRLYDIARSVLRTEADMRRLLRETAEDERRRGLGLAGDPGRPVRATRPGSAASPPRSSWSWTPPRRRPRATGVGIGVIIAANRTKHPLDARTLARLAVAYAGHGRDRVRPVQRRAARPGRGLRARRSGSPSGPGCWPCRTAASWSGRPACRPAWTSCTPTGSATASRPLG